MLILSISPTNDVKPYCFNSTHKRIYSLEELIYHCYYYWKQSIDDFLTGKMEIWISEELKLPYLASRIEKIKDREKTITSQYTAFLNIIDYLDNDDIISITKEVYSWENMDQWKKYKEKGDYALENGQYLEAIKRYLEAVDINDDVSVINNLGVAYMKQENYSDAMICFKKAHSKLPYDEDIVINMGELLYLQGEYDKVEECLEKYEFLENNPNTYILYGEIAYIKQDYEKSLEYFKKANKLGDKYKSLIRMADIYNIFGNYNYAVKAINELENKESLEYYYNYAVINFKFGKVKEAIKQAEKAIEFDKRNIDIWIMLVKLYKKNRDIPQAEKALLKIFEIDPDNEQGKLEYATLKKSQGLIKDYQEILKGILNKWKQKFREEN